MCDKRSVFYSSIQDEEQGPYKRFKPNMYALEHVHNISPETQKYEGKNKKKTRKQASYQSEPSGKGFNASFFPFT